MADLQKPADMGAGPGPGPSKPRIRSASGIGKKPGDPGRTTMPLSPSPTSRADLAPIFDAAKQARFRRRLVLGLIGLILVLGGLVGVRAIKQYLRVPREVLDVEASWKAACATAEDAAKRILVIESRTWMKDQALKPEDYFAIHADVPILQDCAVKISELLRMVRVKTKDGEEDRESRDMDPALLRIKLRILDATDLVASEKDPKKPQGLFVRMHKVLQELEVANAALRAAEEAQGAVVHSKARGVHQKQAATLQELAMRFAGLAEQHADLDDYIQEGLARDGLSARDVPELGQLRGNATLAVQQFQTARNMLRQVEVP